MIAPRLWFPPRAPFVLVLGSACAAFASCVFDLPDVIEQGIGGAAGAPGTASSSSGNGGGTAGPGRLPITLDGSGVTQAVDDFPLAIVLTPDRVDYAATQPLGSDVRFYSAEGTLLAHELESWVPGGTSIAWVLVPRVEPDSMVQLYMHYGEATPETALDPRSVWGGYVAVYHMADPLTGTLVARDSGSNALAANAVMMTAAAAVPGAVGQGFQFDGGTAHLDAGDNVLFDMPPDSVRTHEIWFQRQNATVASVELFAREGCCIGFGLGLRSLASFGLRASAGVACCCSDPLCDDDPPNQPADYSYADIALPGGEADLEWHHTVTVIDRVADELTIYLDGQAAAPIAMSNTGTEAQGSMIIGAAFDASAAFQGVLDEYRLALTGYSAEHVALHYQTMRGMGVSYGAIEPLP
jgi:hypothetical protein